MSVVSDPETATEAPKAEAEKTRAEIFRYADYVHVGDGADVCEHAQDGRCRERGHFHAWVRLPNPFQVRDIAEKARAARARRTRMLRDKDSDPYVILESELDALSSEEYRGFLVDEIIDADFVSDYDTAQRAVMELGDDTFVPESEDDVVPKVHANIMQDQEEYIRQADLPEEHRGEDFAELEKSVARFSKDLQEELESVQKPKKAGLMDLPIEALVERVRAKRIAAMANEVYLHTYNTWQWFVCTYKPTTSGTPAERVFKDFNQFRYETPNDVVRALQVTFSALESSLAGDRAKNS